MEECALFAAACAERYGLPDAALAPLSSSPGANSHSFLVEQPAAVPLVLHAYRADWVAVGAPHETVAARIAGLAALLAALAAQDYPAPRLVPAAGGAATATSGEWSLLLTTYVPGDPADYGLACLRALGAAVGRLHRLRPPEPVLDS